MIQKRRLRVQAIFFSRGLVHKQGELDLRFFGDTFNRGGTLSRI
jgi:hypothetical protein